MPTFNPVQIKGDRAFRLKLEKLQKSIFSQKMMDEIGTFIVFKIQERTMEGKDYQEKLFEPYTDKYALFRQKHGRGTRLVDLDFKGEMISKMTFKASPLKVKVYFLNTKDTENPKVTNAEKAFYLNKKRIFFALNDDDVKDIKEIIENYIARYI